MLTDTGVLASDLGIQKENLLIKIQFGKERHTLHFILKLFTNVVDQQTLPRFLAPS